LVFKAKQIKPPPEPAKNVLTAQISAVFHNGIYEDVILYIPMVEPALKKMKPSHKNKPPNITYERFVTSKYSYSF